MYVCINDLCSVYVHVYSYNVGTRCVSIRTGVYMYV